MLAPLSEARPAAVLSGALAAHYPGSILAKWDNAQMTAGQTQALARHALGETAYDAALSRGAAMDEDEVVRYAVGEFQRVAGLLAQPGAQARTHRRARRPGRTERPRVRPAPHEACSPPSG